MDAKYLLQAADAAPSTVWGALQKLLGIGVVAWEPDTIRIELRRRGIRVSDELMSKILGAQTIVTTFTWTYDHDVLFSFALACDGITASDTAIAHPTPEQLCWAVSEIVRLTGARITNDQGFDPDAIDPAVAVVLHDEAYAVCPEELQFAQDVLEALFPCNKNLVTAVAERWEKMSTMNEAELRERIEDLVESDENIQLRRLADCRLYVLDRERIRARHEAAI